jgi:hypothetical protein
MSLCTLFDSQSRFEFRIDPTEVSWGFHLETDEQLTVGGMVKYIVGLIIDNVRATVEVGIGGIEELKRIQNFVYAHMVRARKSGEPLRFQNPAFPWDLNVYIKNIGGLRQDGVTKNYKLELDMTVLKNNLEMDVFEISDMIGDMVEGITNIATIHTATTSDTLQSIAEQYYADAELGKKLILDVNSNNQAIDGNYVKPGAQIIIPYLTRDPGGNVYVPQWEGGDQNVLNETVSVGTTETNKPISGDIETAPSQGGTGHYIL